MSTIRKALQEYTRLVKRREGGTQWVAYYGELPYCMGIGDSSDTALADLDVMIEPYVKSLLDEGMKLPAPSGVRPHTKLLELSGIAFGKVVGTVQGVGRPAVAIHGQTVHMVAVG